MKLGGIIWIINGALCKVVYKHLEPVAKLDVDTHALYSLQTHLGPTWPPLPPHLILVCIL